MAQVGGRCVAFRQLRVGHERPIGAESDVAHVGDHRRVFHRLRVVREEHRHLFLALDIELRGFEPETLFVGHQRARADAKQDVVSRGVIAAEVVSVVGDDERQ